MPWPQGRLALLGGYTQQCKGICRVCELGFYTYKACTLDLCAIFQVLKWGFCRGNQCDELEGGEGY